MNSSIKNKYTVLFWVPGGMDLMLHTEGALACALSFRGVKVHAVICDGVYKACMLRNITIPAPVEHWGCQGSSESGLSCQQCKATNSSVLEQMGVPYSFIGDYITKPELTYCRTIAHEQTLETINELNVDGISLGNKVSASIIRYYKGQYENIDANIVKEYSRSALISAIAAKNCFKHFKPTRIFMPTGSYVDWGPALEVALATRIPITGWMSSCLSGRFFFGHVLDRHRIVYQNISNSSWNNIVRSNMTEVQQLRLDTYIQRRYFSNESFDLKKNYDFVNNVNNIESNLGMKTKVGLFAHLNWDLAAEGSAMAYPTFNDWIIDTVKTIINITDVHWFIKIHPAEAWESPETGVFNLITTYFVHIPPHITIISADDSMSPLNFIQMVDVGVTAFGTAGLELSLLGKPVILVGEAHYGGKGFTYDGLTPESYRQLLGKASSLPPLNPDQLLLAKKYAYCYFIQRQIPFLVVNKPGAEWWEYQPHKAHLLEPGQDPFTDFICERILDGQDFIMPENLVQLAEQVSAGERVLAEEAKTVDVPGKFQEMTALMEQASRAINANNLPLAYQCVTQILSDYSPCLDATALNELQISATNLKDRLESVQPQIFQSEEERQT